MPNAPRAKLTRVGTLVFVIIATLTTLAWVDFLGWAVLRIAGLL